MEEILLRSIEDLINEIEKLPPPERARLIDLVIRDMAAPDPEIDKFWAQEAAKRWDKYKKGDAKAIPYENVMAKNNQ